MHYMSKRISVQEEKYCNYKLEILAIIKALKKFRSYLLGSKFKIYTNYSYLTKTLSKKNDPLSTQWALCLE